MTNEKRLLERAGLRGVDDVIASLSRGMDPAELNSAADQVQDLFETAGGQQHPDAQAIGRSAPPANNPSKYGRWRW